MAVTRIYRLSTPDLQDEYLRLQATLSRMGLSDITPWTVTLHIYLHRNEQSPAKELYLICDEDTHVGVLSAPQNRYVPVEMKAGLKHFVEAIESYRLSKSTSVEGYQYCFGDFTIKFGLENPSEPKSLLLQIEFSLPLFLSHGTPAITELKNLLDPMNVFSLKTMKYEDRFDMDGEKFSKKHTAADLLIALNCIR